MHTRFRYLIMGFVWLVAAATQAGQTAQFAGWQADCDATGNCEVHAQANGVQLALTRKGMGEPLALLITAPGIVADSDLTLAVDRHPKLALDPIDDLLQETGTALIKIVSQEAKYQLLGQLRVGTRLTVTYRNQYQQKVIAQIALRGLNPALEFIDESQAQVQIVSDLPAAPITAPIPALEPAMPAARPIPQPTPQVPPAADPRQHWAGELIRLMPAINGCLEWVPGVDQVIDKAWVSGGSVTVRARHLSSGARVACVLPLDGSSLDQIESIDRDAGYLPGEGDPIFTPGKHHRPQDECLQHQVVTGANGKPLGWLSFPSC